MKTDRQRLSRTLPARVLIASLALVMGFGSAVAALGQSPANPVAKIALQAGPSGSPGPSGARLQATVRPANFTVHETGLESGTTVTEYATTSGVVFAVQWRGPVLPDLDGLLGTYFAAFKKEAQQARAAGRRGSPMTVVTDALVVNSTGRMRNFAGWAYAPGLVPSDVAIKDVLQ
jgi:Protein of unknown function (DUF2844)